MNTPPSLKDIGSLSATSGQPLNVNVTVDDKETPPENLKITVASDKPDLVPAGAIVVGGGAGTRTITIRPVAGQTGTAVITVTVTDQAGATASDTFILTVNQP